MNKNQKKILEDKLNIKLDTKTFLQFQKYCELFLQYNSHTNLMSKNDEKVLFEKHIFDSLALNLFLENANVKNMLDIGTGGGFPSVPIAILKRNLNIYALDSIKKKINFIQEAQQKLELENLKTICKRAENIDTKMLNKFDLVTCRAVSELKNLFAYATPYLKKSGYFVAFKSKNFQDELDNAKDVIKKSKVKLIKKIDYVLPLSENFERNLLVFQKL